MHRTGGLLLLGVVLTGCVRPPPVSAPSVSPEVSTSSPVASPQRADDPLRAVSFGRTPGCDSTPAGSTDQQQRLQRLAECLTRAQQESLATQGIRLAVPRVVPDGTDEIHFCPSEGPKDWAGNYCPVTATITFRESSADGATGTFLLAHEFGHHLQAASGIWQEIALRNRGRLTEDQVRRLELQAECLAGAMTSNPASPALLPAAQRTAQIDDFARADEPWWPSHGRPETRRRWASAGGRDPQHPFASCNTWAAPADQVL